jgi:hypothetical protein
MLFQKAEIFNLFEEKNKRETGGLDKPPVPQMWRR